MDAAALFLVVGLVVGIVVGVAAAWFVLRARQESTRLVDDAERARLAETARSEAAVSIERARTEAAATVQSAQLEAERARTDAAAARAEAERARADVEQWRGTASQAREEAALGREEAADARAALAAEQARVVAAQAEAAASQEASKALAADRDALVAQFKVLSQETIDRQSQQTDATAADRLKQTELLMQPMTQALQVLQDRLAAVEKQRVELQTELRGEVTAVRRTGDELRRETANLANALRKPQVRGAWGETQLRRVAEMAGMVDRCDFETQRSVQTEDGLLRPDMTIHLSDGKQIFVDSKVPLAAWLDLNDATDEASRASFTATFGRTVRTHVDQLGGKNYWRLADQMAPDFVVLFLPGENFLQAALDGQPDLYDYALRRNVVVATPNTLIALLRTVALGWRQADLAASAREVFVLGRELHERLGTMGSHMDKLGRSLERSVKSYNDAVGTMERRVLVTARKFSALNVVDSELDVHEPIEVGVRPLTAPELTATDLVGLAGAEDERALMSRPEPDTEELAEQGALLALPRRDREVG